MPLESWNVGDYFGKFPYLWEEVTKEEYDKQENPIKYYKYIHDGWSSVGFVYNKIYKSTFVPQCEEKENAYGWNVGEFVTKGTFGRWKEVSIYEYFLQQANEMQKFAMEHNCIILTSEQESPFECKINSILESIKSTLLDKNEKYGNAALQPINIFCKSDSEQGILQRIDDKLMRVKNSNELRKNDVFDLIGYLVLLSVQQDYNFDDLKD
jgi:hypothetical protein